MRLLDCDCWGVIAGMRLLECDDWAVRMSAPMRRFAEAFLLLLFHLWEIQIGRAEKARVVTGNGTAPRADPNGRYQGGSTCTFLFSYFQGCCLSAVAHSCDRSAPSHRLRLPASVSFSLFSSCSSLITPLPSFLIPPSTRTLPDLTNCSH
eukprot:3649144-Rhodomonas_salina.1